MLRGRKQTRRDAERPFRRCSPQRQTVRFRPIADIPHLGDNLDMVWWLRDHGRVLLFILAMGAVFVGIGMFAVQRFKGAATFEQGTILRFGSYSSMYGSTPVLIVKTSEGLIRHLHVDERMTRRCEVGDSIHLVRRGNGLFVRPQGCVALRQ